VERRTTNISSQMANDRRSARSLQGGMRGVRHGSQLLL
jgi:hypothetical protein